MSDLGFKMDGWGIGGGMVSNEIPYRRVVPACKELNQPLTTFLLF